MPLPQLPLVALDDPNHRRRSRETINNILTHQFDDSKIRTPAERLAGITPVNYAYPPGHIYRYGTPGTTTDWSTAIQAAIDSATGAVYLPAGSYGLGTPLLIRSTTVQNLSIIGESRVNTILKPLAASIAVAPVSINALIINQSNNGHLHLKGLRFGPDTVAYTGVALYCKEGGGADSSCQALFSAVFEDIWGSFSTNNAGYFQGGFNNLQGHSMVFESSKTGCFILEGAGIADLLFSDITLNACFDSFIYAALDTQVKDIISVNGLHAYQHLRGPLFEIKNGTNLIFNDIILEPDAANVGTTGLFKLTDCVDVLCTDFYATTAAGNPACATGISLINAFTGKFADGKVMATDGIAFSGTGALDVTFDNVDCKGCDHGTRWVSGTLSGKINYRNCRLNDSQKYGMLVSTGTMSWDLTFSGGEVMNAGMNATATNRNINLSTSGAVLFNAGAKIGQDNGSASAAYYFRFDGSGTVKVSDPRLTGTPPTGLLDPSSAQSITYDGVDSSMAGMPAFTPSLGGTTTYTTRDARYSIKQGILYFHCRLTINAIGSGSQTTISGFPFTSNATYYGGGQVHFWNSSATAVSSIGLTVAPGGTSAILRSVGAAATATANNNILQNGTDLIFSGSYPLP